MTRAGGDALLAHPSEYERRPGENKARHGYAFLIINYADYVNRRFNTESLRGWDIA